MAEDTIMKRAAAEMITGKGCRAMPEGPPYDETARFPGLAVNAVDVFKR